MYPLLKIVHTQSLHTYSVSLFSNLIDHCRLSKSLSLVKCIHAQLVKVSLNRHTFLGNRFVELYSKVGSFNDSLRAFDDIACKNVISWNICLNVFIQSRNMEGARLLFDEMPVKDIVSWNSMILGYASHGFVDNGLQVFVEMQRENVSPSEYTFSILVSFLNCTRCGKQIHGSMIRHGVNSSNVVVGNSLIDMYGKHGLIDYAFGVFLTMEELDVISWNSLISGCYRSGNDELALNQFSEMRISGHSPDRFTLSTLITICSKLGDLQKGEQVFALCIKLGFLSNTIVSSAAVDLFSKCNRIDHAISIFEETDVWDSALCNSMLSSYTRHSLHDHALRIFVLMLRIDIIPTEFTLSCLLSSASNFISVERGTQLHSFVVKLGFESDSIVANSLVKMYCKHGSINSAKCVYAKTGFRDLISWNTMILGMAYNGEVAESINLFFKLLNEGQKPNQITLGGILLALNYGGFVDEGLALFSSMEEKYGVLPANEHYACIVEMMSRVGRLKEAIDILETMNFEPNYPILGSLICGCGDLKFTEFVAERMMELEPRSILPYLVLAQEYEMRGRWESLVRVKKIMKERGVKKPIGSSWIGLKNGLLGFKASQMFYHGDKEIYEVLNLLTWQMEDEDVLEVFKGSFSDPCQVMCKKWKPQVEAGIT